MSALGLKISMAQLRLVKQAMLDDGVTPSDFTLAVDEGLAPLVSAAIDALRELEKIIAELAASERSLGRIEVVAETLRAVLLLATGDGE